MTELQQMHEMLSFDWEWEIEGEIGDEEVSERLWELFLAKGCKVEFFRQWSPKTEPKPIDTKTNDPKRRPSLTHSLTKRRSVLFDHFKADKEEQLSPLMKAVQQNYLKTAFSLLMYGANPNLQHTETGDTALHMAVKNVNVSMVKALLAANADTTIVNNLNQAPFDIAVNLKQRIGTPDIKLALVGSMIGLFGHLPDPVKDIKVPETANSSDIDTILEAIMEAYTLQNKTLKYFSEHSSISELPTSPEGTYLLCLDGGGVRAFNVTQAMVNIEERMAQLTSDNCNNLYQYFDYIAGTSSGGIAACALPYRQVDAYSGRAIVHRGATNVFGGPFAERGDRMDVFLQDIFTPDMRMNELEPPSCSIVTGTLATVSPYKLHLMTSYGGPRNGQLGPAELKVWEACRLSTAAPTYFPILRDIKILDGGLVANNPTLDSMADIIAQEKSEGKNIKFACVVSIGTGLVPEIVNNDDVNLFEPSNFSYLSNASQTISALTNLISHFATRVTLTDGTEVTRAREFCHALGSRYYRMTPPLKEDVDLATADIQVLINMIYNTQMYYLDNPEMIDEIAKLLLLKKKQNNCEE